MKALIKFQHKLRPAISKAKLRAKCGQAFQKKLDNILPSTE
jgi:hypothetical protein